MSAKQRIGDARELLIGNHQIRLENSSFDKLKEITAGDSCPVCQIGSIDYDGLLNLVCSQCGYTVAGCFT